jgi:hypothetical protein
MISFQSCFGFGWVCFAGFGLFFKKTSCPWKKIRGTSTTCITKHMPAVPADPALYRRIQNKVKERVDRWPSAYASGQVVQEYKAAMNARGLEPYLDSKPSTRTGLSRWYRERWIDIATGKPCGSAKTTDYYPTCRPSRRITSKSPVTARELTPSQRKKMVKHKQHAGPKTVRYTQTKRSRVKRKRTRSRSRK